MLHLSCFSTHLPKCGECLHCRFLHDCNGGEMCVVNEKQWQKEEETRRKAREKYNRRMENEAKLSYK